MTQAHKLHNWHTVLRTGEYCDPHGRSHDANALITNRQFAASKTIIVQKCWPHSAMLGFSVI